MSKKVLAAFLAFCLLMGGCALNSAGGETEDSVIYRVESSVGNSKIVKERIDSPLATAEEVLSCLNAGGEDAGAEAYLPGGVQLELISLNKGVAKVDLSGEYSSLRTREKLLTEGAVALSLFTLDRVCYVELSCGEEFIGLFGVEDFVEGDSVCDGYERLLKLYLPNPNAEFIEPRSIKCTDADNGNAAEIMLRQLFVNIGNGMENTNILSVSIENGVCRVDLSEEFYGAEPAGSIGGMVIIYSMVNSLCRLDGINAVHIKVDGNEVTSYGGFIPMWPLAENMSMVRYE